MVQAIFVQVKPGKNAFDPAAIEDARNLRADLEPLVEGTDLRSGVTGPAAQSLDSQESSQQGARHRQHRDPAAHRGRCSR